MSSPVAFKYRFVDGQGQVQGFRAAKGSLDDEGLKLKDRMVPATSILSAHTRDKRVVFGHIDPSNGQPTGMVVEIYGAKVADLAKAYNRIGSQAGIQRRQAELEAQGRGHEMEVSSCQCCSASIDMTGFPDSHEVYCPLCSNISSGSVPPAEQEKIRVCDKCGYYAVPRGITCFYFYFLLVVYGFRWQRKHMCGPCMRSEGWKMLAGNAIFLLGVPVAITQLIRAYAGSALATTAYKGLERANLAARKGQADDAARRYDEVSQRLGGSAIALFNKGRGLAMANRVNDAAHAFEDALQSCSNFYPAAEGLAACLSAQKQDPMKHPLLQCFKQEQEAQPASA
jgi:hypothetical protein